MRTKIVAAVTTGLASAAALAAVIIGGAESAALACSTVSPGGSFNAAYKASDAGCVIIVKTGIYPEQVITLDSSKGTAPVVFQGESGVVVNGDLASGAPTATPNGAHNVTFRNMKATWLVTRTGAQNIRFENMRTTSINFNAGPVTLADTDVSLGVNIISHIKQSASGVLIERTAFHDATISDTARHSECLMIWESASNVTIRDSTFRNCTDFNVLVKASPSRAISFENVRMDEPMPGNVVTANCSPDCPRGGSSIRYSSFQYPDSRVSDSCLGGGLTIDVPGFVTVTNTKTNTAGCLDQAPPPPPTQCADGIDNDSDGLIDLADPGCIDAADNDESNAPPPYNPSCAPTCDEQIIELTNERNAAQAEVARLGGIVDRAAAVLAEK